MGLAPVCVDCLTGPAEILLRDGDTSLFERQLKEGKKPVIYGEYGILVPVMNKSRDLDANHILGEERNMAGMTKSLRGIRKRPLCGRRYLPMRIMWSSF